LVNEQPSPESPSLTPLIRQSDDHEEQDPFVIDLAWNAVPNATLYIVEFFPHDRAPKPGESNFFQVMTTSLAYKVRKDDECVEYSGRVIAVNSYGISNPSYVFVGAPTPSMRPGDHLVLRNIQRDPWSPDMIIVTIDYVFPGWPALDVDIDNIRITASDCKGMLGDRTFTSPTSSVNPSYRAIIDKEPTTAIQLYFFDDVRVLEADCLFHLKIVSLSTRCNTSVSYESNMDAAPGIDFRINCDTAEDACDNGTAPVVPPPQGPIPIPLTISVDPDVVVPPLSINTPSHVPPGIERPPSPNAPSDPLAMPEPPTLPLSVMGQGQEDPNPMPPGSRISVIDLSDNGTSVETISIIPELTVPPLCELDMLDVEPSVSPISNSVIDLRVLWLERQPLPPPPPATYFAIRYGPIVRKLVDDDREPTDIIPGYETIVRTGQHMTEMPFLPDPTREVNISSVQRGSLLMVQICAIFDPNSEPLIAWDTVQSRRIDLAALEPFLELDDFQSHPPTSDDLSPFDIQNMAGAAIDDMSPVSPVLVPFDPPMQSNNEVNPDVPLLIAVNVQPTTTPTTYWLTVTAGALMILLTVLLILLLLRRLCTSRRLKKTQQPPMYVVSTVQSSPPVYKEEVKVPLS